MAREVVNKMDITTNERLLEKLGCITFKARVPSVYYSNRGTGYSTKGAIGTFAEKLSTTQEGYEIYKVRYALAQGYDNTADSRGWLFLAYDPVSGINVFHTERIFRQKAGSQVEPGTLKSVSPTDDFVKRLQTKIKKTVKAKLLGAA